MHLTVSARGPLRGSIAVPPDKSMTHRAAMFAARATSPSVIINPLTGEDCHSTLNCLRALGCQIEEHPNGTWGVFPSGWISPEIDLDCGNSGTTIRLLSGLIAAQPIRVRMVGDASLSKRPMKRIVDPLVAMGAQIHGDRTPLEIHGGNLRGIDYVSPVASAQVKSCILLAGLGAEGETWVTEPAPSRDHTERMLQGLGVDVRRTSENRVGVAGGATWRGFEFTVPGDISSAAFWLAAAAILPNSEVTLQGVGINSTRTGILDVLEQADAEFELHNECEQSGEPIADIVVRGRPGLKPFSIQGPLVPRLIDEIPVLAVMATQCQGVTEIRDAKEMRVKETDRIAVVCEGLRSMGAKVEVYEDGMAIEGPTPLHGAAIDATGDHRIGMAFSVAGLVATGETRVENADSIATSYPDFEKHLNFLTGVIT
ncbi:MAG: 3-phosphoshikimate 1-carboxyvinyltransferase [Armatimonadetes bacterium]|nr:3-phosphoshikimate 1-carboxyvinyltransferase [Armatimonadota bacterium]